MSTLESIWYGTGEPTEHTHARLWPGTGRALCTGAPSEHLSAEAPTDEDADVTCEDCLRTIREANKEVQP